MKRTLRSTCLLLILSSSTRNSLADTIGFDTASDLNRFSVQSDLGSVYGSPEWAAVGLGGGGGARVVGTQPSNYPYAYLVNNERSFRLSEVGESVQLSLMFRYKHPVQVSNGGGVTDYIASLGVTSDPTRVISFPAQLRVALTLTQFSPSLPIATEINVSSFVNGGGSGRRYALSTLADDHWYRLSARFSIINDLAKPNRFDFALQDFGTSGAAPVATLLMETHGDQFFADFRDETAWVGFGLSRVSGAGAEAVDNFTFIPEPYSKALALPCLALVATSCRRSRRKRA